MSSNDSFSRQFRLAGQICKYVGWFLLGAGALVLLTRPLGEGEGDVRPIVVTEYAVWLLIAGGVLCFTAGVCRYASED